MLNYIVQVKKIELKNLKVKLDSQKWLIQNALWWLTHKSFRKIKYYCG